jgi:thiamine-phosphate pyrophosphorylase
MSSQPRDAAEPLATSPELQMAWRDPTQTDLFETCRILDAAANRAREGLRVVEDFVRWAWNDSFLSQSLKECRHELTGLLRQLPQPALLAARDTAHDVGTEIRTASEYRRETPAAVATASLKRTEEALRSLEEYSKVIDADLSPRFEQLRYRIYTLDKAIHSTDAARLRLADQKICLLATNSLCHHGIGPAVLGALKAGVKMIQLREKSLPDRELIQIAGYVRRWTKEAEAIFIVNDRPDIAALVNADGVHLGQDDLSVADARKILGPDKLVGVSTHSLEQARQAVLDGADYLGVGPCFPSSTKTFDKFPGLEFAQQVAGEISLPWFAIGGIASENLTELKIVGATRIAVSSAICSAEEPIWAAEELVYRLNQ